MSESLPQVLQQKAEQVSRAAEMILAKTRDWQLIREYMNNRLDEIELTEVQKEKMHRYQYIYNQQVSGRYTDAEVVSQVTKIYKVEISQAYEDMASTRELFNSIINVNKLFELKLKLDINKNYQRKCAELGDMKSLAKFEKNGIEIAKLLEDMEDDRGELFEGHVYEMTFDPSLLGAAPISKKDLQDLLKQINEKRSKKIRTDMFEELEFEEKEASDGG
jgi:hypothetical protein